MYTDAHEEKKCGIIPNLYFFTNFNFTAFLYASVHQRDSYTAHTV